MNLQTNRAAGIRRQSNWLLFVGGILLLGAIGVMLRTPPADGFELSIYVGYPPSFWVLLVSTLFVGMLLIFREAFADSPRSRYWVGGFLLTLYTVATLLVVPIVRGYTTYGRADLFTHIGHVHVIHETGGEPFQNIYQNLHQVVLALSYATGLEPMAIVNAIPVVISLLSIIASYTLLSVIFDRRRMLMTLPFVVALVAGSTHLNPSPYAQSVLFLPFVLYLFARTQETGALSFKLALAIAVVAVVLYHPLMAVFLVVVLALHYLVVTYSSWRGTLDVSAPVSRASATTIIQLAGVTFLVWYYNFVGIILRFDVVFRHLLNPADSETELDTYGATISEFSPSVLDVARVAAFRYGNRFVFLALGVLFIAVAVWTYARGDRFSTPYLSTFTLGFIAFSAFGALFLLVNLIGGFGRPLVVAQYFGAFLAGSILFELYDRVDRNTALFVVAIAIAVLLATSSVATLYTSSMASASTNQVTQQDVAGAEWYLGNELQTTPLKEYGTAMYRFEHALNGSDSNAVQRAGTAPPPRFNYTEHERLGASFDADQYLVITERGKQFYPNAYPGYDDSWQFQPTDFETLLTDPSVRRIYSNGEFEIYRVDTSGDAD